MNKDPFDYLQPYIVSLGEVKKTPIGSGTLVQFSVADTMTYAVLTATHVLEDLGLLDYIRSEENSYAYPSICLSKPINRNGDVVGSVYKPGFATELDAKHYRHLKQNHRKDSGNKIYYERDMALLILEIGHLSKCDLTDHSSFFDLDHCKLQVPAFSSE